jgi:hypothetical protein
MSRRDSKVKVITASRQFVFLVLFSLVFRATTRSPNPNVNGLRQLHLGPVRKCHGLKARGRCRDSLGTNTDMPMGAAAYYERMTLGGGETNGTVNEWAFYH